jgi:septal ring factor EnvC (AmiA/AmiB activator)
MTTVVVWFQAAILATLAYIAYAINEFERQLMSTQDSIDAIVAQLAKVKDEVAEAKFALTDQINELTTQLEDAKAADQVDLSGLEAIVQTLDDINPDPETVEVEAEAQPVEDSDDDLPVKGDGDR